MGDARFQLLGVRDSRIAAHAISVHPAWLWSADGLRLLWCNAAAAAAFGIREPLRPRPLQTTTFSIAHLRTRQLTQLVARLSPGKIRLERLRDFGKPLGGLLTCACTPIDLQNGESTVLIVGMEPVGRAPAAQARLQWLVDGLDHPASAFDSEGTLVASNMEARALAGHIQSLSDLGASSLPAGNDSVTVEAGRIKSSLHVIGSDHDKAIIAVMALQPAKTAAPPTPPVVTEPVGRELEPPAAVEATSFLFDSIGESGHHQAPPASEHHPSVSSALAIAGHETWTTDRMNPVRFVWQMNAAGRFSLGTDEFSRLLGPQTAAALGRPWDEIAETFGLDPEGRVAKAVATRQTWSGIIVDWPFDGFGGRLPVELSALPLYDRARNFLGYRGFGICRDVDGLNQIALLRQEDGLFGEQTAEPNEPVQSIDPEVTEPADEPARHHITNNEEPEAAPVDTPLNVVPFRPLNEAPPPTLTQVENNAFDEIARRLSEGLGATGRTPAEPESPFGQFSGRDDADSGATDPVTATPDETDQKSVGDGTAPWLSLVAPPPRGESLTDRPLLDLMPAGVLIYRLDHLLYANKALLERVGFADLHALQSAGGLEALYIEPQSSSISSTSAGGMPLIIAATGDQTASSPGRLFSVQWDGEPAHALVLSAEAPRPAEQKNSDEAAPDAKAIVAADVSAILEAATDAIVLFDRSGAVTACNRRAQTLFGYSSPDFMTRNLTDLFAFESQRIVLDYFENIDRPHPAAFQDHGREVVGCKQGGQFTPLSMTMGRGDQGNEHFFAVFRDLSQLKQNEADLLNARRRADRATSAKSDVLAKISHDIRAPLNTIIGFANMMIEEKLGALGNTRYLEYTKDIRASAERVLAILGEMVDLSQVETGKIELNFQQQSLNEVVEQCVGLAQPQASRERIIIRTSLAHHLPSVSADTQALRQIATNLITSSIRLSKAGGQVIVSTALDDAKGAVLRVRDMGRGLSETEIATAMDPYRSQAPSDMAAPDAGVDLSLTKALAEANRARFQIKSTPQTGTLIEVAFPAA